MHEYYIFDVGVCCSFYDSQMLPRFFSIVNLSSCDRPFGRVSSPMRCVCDFLCYAVDVRRMQGDHNQYIYIYILVRSFRSVWLCGVSLNRRFFAHDTQVRATYMPIFDYLLNILFFFRFEFIIDATTKMIPKKKSGNGGTGSFTAIRRQYFDNGFATMSNRIEVVISFSSP